jgi:hypothetical protein
VLDDVAAEAVGQSQVDRKLKDVAPLGEILIDLTRRVVQPGGGVHDARADGIGEAGQRRLVALDVVGDPYQADGRGGQQQRADRGVDGAVGDVEHAGVVGAVLEPSMQSRQRGLVRVEAFEKVDTHDVWSSW